MLLSHRADKTFSFKRRSKVTGKNPRKMSDLVTFHFFVKVHQLCNSKNVFHNTLFALLDEIVSTSMIIILNNVAETCKDTLLRIVSSLHCLCFCVLESLMQHKHKSEYPVFVFSLLLRVCIRGLVRIGVTDADYATIANLEVHINGANDRVW